MQGLKFSVFIPDSTVLVCCGIYDEHRKFHPLQELCAVWCKKILGVMIHSPTGYTDVGLSALSIALDKQKESCCSLEKSVVLPKKHSV